MKIVVKTILALAIFATSALAGVGFKSKILDNNGRPIKLFIWYPAKAEAKAKSLTFRDYVDLLPDKNKEEWLSTAVTGDPKGINKETQTKIFGLGMKAVRNAKPKEGLFPLVLWTMRHETEVAQSMLNEYVTEYGYVVAVARYAGEPLSFPWAIKSPEEKKEVFQQHLSDLEFALGSLSRELNVDDSNVAIMNWSYAAELSPLMQIRNQNVKMVIGLSSNPLSSAGVYQGKDAALNLVPGKLVVPYVIMSERIGTDGKVRTAPVNLLNKMQAESLYLEFTGLAHGNFNMVEGYIPGKFGIEKVQPWSVGGKSAVYGYKEIMRHTVSSLDLYLRDGRPSLPKAVGGKIPKGLSLRTFVFNRRNK